MLSEVFRMDNIMAVCEKICYFLVVNLLFLACNLPVLLFFLFVGISQVETCLPLFLLCLLPAPPSFAAVLYGMGKLVRGKESGPLRDFKKGLVTDFWQKFRMGAVQLFLLFIFWTDIRFFSRQAPFLPLVIVFSILFAFCILVTPNLYLLASRYQMTSRQIVKTACVLTVTRPVHTLGNVAALGIVLMLLEISAGTTVLFMVSVYGFLVAFMSKKVFQALEALADEEPISETGGETE